MNMNPFLISLACVVIFYIWYARNGRKLQERIERIRRIMIHGPDARICYMNMRGKRYILQITIESVMQKGQDWIVTAWCHEKNEFVVFYASRMYEYFDLKHFQEIKNVQ
jgi:predicted DNA-binding transcriptional regulator YafY